MDNMQLWLSSSTDSINLNDSAEGFYLNPDLEGLTGLPEIRSVNGLNAGYDGGWTATQLWAARLITIRGVIAINDKAAVEDKRKALAKILSQGKNEDLELRFVSEAGNTYTTTVRTSYCTMALQRVFWRQEYQIQLRANDPLIYDDGGSELIAILRVMAGEGGFEIPFDIPFDIGSSITPTSIDVGDEATYPLIHLKGDLHNPTVINMTTNQRMQVLADIITTIEWHDYTTACTIDGFAQIGDGIDGAPLSLTHLYGNATQETTTGKNLVSTSFHNSTIVDYGENGFILTKPATRTQALDFPTPLPAGTYTFSANVVANTVDNNTGIQLRSSNLAYTTFSVPAGQTGQISFTTTTTDEMTRVYFYILNDATDGSSITFDKIQIEAGSTATDFEPYTAGPSPNPSYPQDVNVVTGAQTVKITGKNLFNFQEFAEDKIKASGCARGTATYSGNSITLTATGNDCYTRYGYSQGYPPLIKVKKNADMVLSWKTNTVGTYKGLIYIFGINASGGADVIVNVQDIVGKRTFNTGDYDIISFRLGVSSTGDSITYSDIMLEYGSQPSQYEPYQSQSQEINLGKNLNLTDVSTSGHGITFTTSDGVMTIDGTSDTIVTAPTTTNTSDYARLKAGTYTMSANNPVADSNVIIRLRHTDGTVISATSTTLTTANTVRTLTLTQEEIVCIEVRIASGAVLNDFIIKPQLEVGYQATSFSPYFTPIELAKIGNYQDYIWNDEGTWYIHKEVGHIQKDANINAINSTGGSSPTYQSFYGAFGIYKTDWDNAGGDYDNDIALARMSENIGQYVEQNLPANVSANSMQDGTFCQRTGTNDRLYFRCSGLTGKTGNEVKALLQPQGGAQFYYGLATPTDTEITDSDLIEQLNHIYSLYQGQNNLWLIPSAGAQGEMEVSYATTEDIDYHEVVIDCQARTVTQDGHNLYPALAEGSEFIRLLPGENKLYLTSEVESDNGTAEVKFKKGNISI